MSSQYWLEGLNPEQAEAVMHDHGPLLILAGAGSGKTTVLVSRTGRLIAERVAPAENILVMTFTNKAAKELKHRVQKRIGPGAKKLWTGTFHSFGLNFLKKHHELADLSSRFNVIDQSDAQAILKDLLKDKKVIGKDKFDLETLLQSIHLLRCGQKISPSVASEYHEMAEMLVAPYVKRMNLLDVVDFEGLLLEPLAMFKKHPEILKLWQEKFSQIMVDEFQDTNHIQMQLVQALSGFHKNLTVVGDDDQSIYAWRGAQVANILSFPQTFKGAKVVKLEKNYRSSAEIINLANHVIAKNSHRHGKTLVAQKKLSDNFKPELFILENEDEESDFIVNEIRLAQQKGFSLDQIAVLYRSNTQGGLFESALRKERIDYQITGGSSLFERKEAKDVLAYLRAAYSSNEISLRRILNVPARGLGDITLEKLALQSKSSKIPFIVSCRRWKEALVHAPAGQEIENFLKSLEELKNKLISGAGTAGENLCHFLTENGYKSEVLRSGTKPGAGERKWSIVEILARVLDTWMTKKGRTEESIQDFLDTMALRDAEDDEEESVKRVSLMTFHASKGLEFPYVILAGIEEDLLPHRSLGSDIDEERRLFYVGITRAQQHLMMTRCQTRLRFGQQRPVAPSRFLLDLPPGLWIERQGSHRPVNSAQREALVSDFFAKIQASRANLSKTDAT